MKNKKEHERVVPTSKAQENSAKHEQMLCALPILFCFSCALLWLEQDDGCPAESVSSSSLARVSCR